MENKIAEITIIFEEVVNMLDQCGRIPFTDRTLIPQKKLLATLNKLKETMPGEIIRANKVLATSVSILENAKVEALEIMRRAQDQAKKINEEAHAERIRLLNESEISQQAEKEANALLQQAETTGNKTRQEANIYAEEAKIWAINLNASVRKELNEQFKEALKSIAETRQNLYYKIEREDPLKKKMA